MNISELETPCLILDQGKMARNIAAMRDHIVRLGVRLRPHGKTPKCIQVVRAALAGQAEMITASTLKEAEYFFSHGITDILYAVGIAPVKLERIAKLRQQGADVTIILDSIEQARLVAAHGRKLGCNFPALIELDSDGHRSGVTLGRLGARRDWPHSS